MEIVDGGDWITRACGAFAVAAGAYTIGVAANFWNPVGWVGGLIMGGTAIACGSYALYNSIMY